MKLFLAALSIALATAAWVGASDLSGNKSIPDRPSVIRCLRGFPSGNGTAVYRKAGVFKEIIIKLDTANSAVLNFITWNGPAPAESSARVKALEQIDAVVTKQNGQLVFTAVSSSKDLMIVDLEDLAQGQGRNSRTLRDNDQYYTACSYE